MAQEGGDFLIIAQGHPPTSHRYFLLPGLCNPTTCDLERASSIYCQSGCSLGLRGSPRQLYFLVSGLSNRQLFPLFLRIGKQSRLKGLPLVGSKGEHFPETGQA